MRGKPPAPDGCGSLLDVEAPPVRDPAVDRVVAELDEAGVDVSTGIELVGVADRLMNVADGTPVGPGTARMTVAGAAVYAADRLTEGKTATQAEVVNAVKTVVGTSTHKKSSYSRTLHDEATQHLQPADVVGGLVEAD